MGQLGLETALVLLSSHKKLSLLENAFATISRMMYAGELTDEAEFTKIEKVLRARYNDEQDNERKWWMIGMIAEIITPAHITTLSRLQKVLSGVMIDEINRLVGNESVLPDVLAVSGAIIVRALEAATISKVEGAKECLETVLVDNLYFGEFTLEEAQQALNRLKAMKL